MAPVRTFKLSNPESHLNIVLTKTANSVLSDAVHVTYQVFHFFRNVIRFHGTPIPVLSCTLWKITAFPELIFTEFKNIQHHYVNISYAEFHQNRRMCAKY
jgi:hypothetical protein